MASFSGRALKDLTRSLLHDTGRGMATSARFYDDDVIFRALNIAQQELALALIMREPRASVTVRKLLKKDAGITPGFPGSNVQSDFWLIECGYATVGGRLQYCPGVTIELGERTSFFDTTKIYVRGGKYFGTATTALYWKTPTKIADTTTVLTDFPDAFYHVVKLRAASDLVAQDDHDALDRYKDLIGDYQRAVASLK